jgi:hypothetical protein
VDFAENQVFMLISGQRLLKSKLSGNVKIADVLKLRKDFVRLLEAFAVNQATTSINGLKYYNKRRLRESNRL